MTAFLSVLSQIADFVFGMLTSIFNLYTGTVVLACVLGLWIVRKIVNLIKAIT